MSIQEEGVEDVRRMFDGEEAERMKILYRRL